MININVVVYEQVYYEHGLLCLWTALLSTGLLRTGLFWKGTILTVSVWYWQFTICFFFAETFRSFVRNSLKSSFFVFGYCFVTGKRQYDRFDLIFLVIYNKVCLLLQPLRWCCVDCVIHYERDVREEQRHTYMWREQAKRVIVAWKLCRY